MAYEQKDMTGSIFKNERKTTDQHPNMTGSCLIDGVAYFVDAWTNEVQSGEKAGQKYQALKFKRKEKQALPGAATRSPVGNSGTGFDRMDDDIPF